MNTVPDKMSRRTMLKLTAAGGGMLALAACSSTNAGTTTTGAGSTTASAGGTTTPAGGSAASAGDETPTPAGSLVSSSPGSVAAGSGGTLKAGSPTDILALDPISFAANAGTQTFYLHLVYNRLFNIDPSNKIIPELAETVDIAADGMSITMKLRQGVLFHTGREFTSDDVEWNITRIKTAKKTNNFYSTAAPLIAKIDKIDKYNVLLTLAQPTVQVLNFFNLLYLSDQQTIEGPNAATKAVGTGPFKMDSWTPGSGAQYSRWEKYWQSGQPALSSISDAVVTDSQTLSAQFQSEQVDMAYGMALQDAKRVATGGATTVLDPIPQVISLIFDYSIKPFDNQMVREAFQYAIDRTRVAQIVSQTLGAPATVIWPKSSPAYDATMAAKYTFDLDKAKSLLKQAGVSSATMTLQCSVATPNIPTASELIRADLAKIGITLNTQTFQSADWTDLLNNRTSKGIIATNLNILPDPGATLNQVFFLSPDPKVAPGRFSDTQYTSAVAKSGDLTLSTDARIAAAKAATQIMVDTSFIVPICTYPQALVASSKVHDISFFLSPIVNATSVQ